MLAGITWSKSPKRLTILLDTHMKSTEVQDILEQLTISFCCSQVTTSHSLSSVQFVSQPGQIHKIVLKSNCAWDSKVSPSLIVNWLHEQKTGKSADLLGGHALGHMIRAINRGTAHARAANVVSRDRTVSCACAIFDCIHGVFSRFLKDRERKRKRESDVSAIEGHGRTGS
jgi:hypothetical protein